MRLDNAFTVTAPIEQVWATVMDVERVAGCVPGASVLDRLSDDAYKVGMRVKLGPVTTQYRGQLEVVERDEEKKRAVLRGKAKESRGQGTADATVELTLAQEGGETQGRVHADVTLSGRAAAMGQGVINSVADQLMAQFTGNLQAMLTAPEGADVTDPAGEPDAATGPAEMPGAVQRSGETVTEAAETLADGTRSAGVSARSAPSGRVAGRIATSDARPSTDPYRGKHVDRDDDESLDPLALARGVFAPQVRQPRVLAGLVAVALLLAYLLGWASGRRRDA